MESGSGLEREREREGKSKVGVWGFDYLVRMHGGRISLCLSVNQLHVRMCII